MKKQTFLVPTDLLETSEAAIRYAFELAAKLDATVSLLHVYPATVVPDGAGSGYIPHEALRRSALERLQRQAAPYMSSPVMGRCLVELGEPSLVILEQVRELAVDLLIVGTHARQGLPRVLIGSVAERVIRAASCPVLVVKLDRESARASRPSEALPC